MIYGFIKLPRNLIAHPVFDVPQLFHTFCYLLFNASWENKIIIIDAPNGISKLEIKKGQFFMTRSFVAQHLKINIKTLDAQLKMLEKDLNLISSHKRNFGTIITILNWNDYNGIFDDDGITKGTANCMSNWTANCPANGTAKRTTSILYNTKEIEEIEEINTHTAQAREDFQLFNPIIQTIYSQYPKKQSPRSAMSSISQALEDVSKTSNPDDALFLILSGTIAYATAVSFWSDPNQAKNPIRFYQDHDFNSDWNVWLPRNSKGSASDNSWSQEEIESVFERTKKLLKGGNNA